MRTLFTALCSLLAAILLSAFPTPLVAQSSQGGLRGVVKDSQGVIPGVTVTMVNGANGVSRDTVTNGVGEYSFPAVEPGNSAMSMGGGAVRANNYLVDGFPVTDLQNRASTNPTMEAVQDVKVQVHTYDAEMGRTGGGVMNMAAKSGGNSFHASGYGVFRPERFVE